MEGFYCALAAEHYWGVLYLFEMEPPFNTDAIVVRKDFTISLSRMCQVSVNIAPMSYQFVNWYRLTITWRLPKCHLMNEFHRHGDEVNLLWGWVWGFSCLMFRVWISLLSVSSVNNVNKVESS